MPGKGEVLGIHLRAEVRVEIRINRDEIYLLFANCDGHIKPDNAARLRPLVYVVLYAGLLEGTQLFLQQPRVIFPPNLSHLASRPLGPSAASAASAAGWAGDRAARWGAQARLVVRACADWVDSRASTAASSHLISSRSAQTSDPPRTSTGVAEDSRGVAECPETVVLDTGHSNQDSGSVKPLIVLVDGDHVEDIV